MGRSDFRDRGANWPRSPTELVRTWPRGESGANDSKTVNSQLDRRFLVRGSSNPGPLPGPGGGVQPGGHHLHSPRRFRDRLGRIQRAARSHRPASRLHDGRVHDRLRPLRDAVGLSRRPVRRQKHPGGHHPRRLDAHSVPGSCRFPAAERVLVVAFLVLLRFLFGAFQAGTFPSISRMMADWMPTTERGSAQGTIWMSSRMGGALAPLALGLALRRHG